MLNIDGLMEAAAGSSDADGVTTLLRPSGIDVRGGQGLRVTRWVDGTARVLLVDRDGSQPTLGLGEDVVVASVGEEALERVVRAMAVLHLGIEEAATGWTEADSMLVAGGFGIGRTGTGAPAWMRLDAGWTTIVERHGGGGLPSRPCDPARSALVGPGGRAVTLTADDLPSSLAAIGSGMLRGAFDPNRDVEISTFTPRGRNLH